MSAFFSNLKVGIVIFSLEKKESKTTDGNDISAKSLYKTKNVKIELSNKAATSLTAIDLND